MAAVLCQGIGSCCSGCGKLICLPFQLCDKACQGLCKGCSAACEGVCKGCSNVCDTIGNICTSPFFPYLGVTFVLNVFPIIYGISPGIINWCESLSIWLLINAILAAIHIGASFYIVTQIRMPLEQMPTATTGIDTEIPANDMEANNNAGGTQSSTQQQQPSSSPSLTPQQRIDAVRTVFTMPQQEQRGEADTWSRVKHVLCLDKIVAVYILLFIGWIILLTVGIARVVIDDTCSDGLPQAVNISITCGFLYLFSVGVAFSLSLCCLGR